MNDYIVFFVISLISIYAGQVVGLLIYCDNCKFYKSIKKYVWLVPILNAITTVCFIVDCIKDTDWSRLFWFVRLRGKHLLVMFTIVETLPNTNTVKQKHRRKKHHTSKALSPIALVKSILIDANDGSWNEIQYM